MVSLRRHSEPPGGRRGSFWQSVFSGGPGQYAHLQPQTGIERGTPESDPEGSARGLDAVRDGNAGGGTYATEALRAMAACDGGSVGPGSAEPDGDAVGPDGSGAYGDSGTGSEGWVLDDDIGGLDLSEGLLGGFDGAAAGEVPSGPAASAGIDLATGIDLGLDDPESGFDLVGNPGVGDLAVMTDPGGGMGPGPGADLGEPFDLAGDLGGSDHGGGAGGADSGGSGGVDGGCFGRLDPGAGGAEIGGGLGQDTAGSGFGGGFDDAGFSGADPGAGGLDGGGGDFGGAGATGSF
jgi:hypothetical protein